MLKGKRKLSRESSNNTSHNRSLSTTGKKRKTKNDKELVGEEDEQDGMKDSVFIKMIEKAGLIISNGKQQNQCRLDQTIFQKNLSNNLKRDRRYPQIVDEFTEGITSYIENPKRFCYALLPSLTAEDCEESTRGPTQDSLMRMMLGIDILQPAVANILLEKIPEFPEGDKRVGDCDIPRLIMSQFKWLDVIIKPKELSQKLLEVISVSDIECQREVITCVPEIMDDNEHTEIGTELINVMMQNSELTIAVLDTLTNLNLKAEMLNEVRSSVINMLASMEVDNLPVAVKFVLQSVSNNEAYETVTELRSHLEFACPLLPAATSTPSHAKSKLIDKSKDGVLLTLEAIKSCVRFQKLISDAWIKAIENVKSSAEHLIIDLFVILILHNVTNKRKIVEGLLRAKVRSGFFTEDVLKSAFISHPQVLREYFDTLLILSEVLLRSPDPVVSSYGQQMYVHSFLAFDLYCKQEVVGALVTHIGSGFASETDSSLDVLKDLVENHALEMSRFAIFLKGILDYMDNLTICQIRKLFSLLSLLAYYNNDGSMIQDDMHMVIRKQLSSNSVKYKRIGIIGAIMIVRGMTRLDTDTIATSSKSEIANRDKQVTNLLGMVRTSVSNEPEAAALFYDELANVIEREELDSGTKSWISDTICTDFQEDCLIDLESELPNSGMPVDLLWGLDDREEGCVGFNLVNLLLQRSGKQHNHSSQISQFVSPICSAPHFRLLQVIERSQEGNLTGIDALLGCPVVMFKVEEVISTLEKMSKEDKELICTSLFCCLNWFIELINAFSGEDDDEMKGKIISRLQTMTTLQKWLEQCLLATPSFIPPLVHFDVEAKNVAPKLSNGVKRTRKGDTKNKSKDSDKTIDDLFKDTQNEIEAKEETFMEDRRKDKRTSTNILSSVKFRAHLRELDLKVFEILKCGLVSKAVLDSNMNTETKVILQLQAAQLYFLLDDLSKKLDHSLSSAGKGHLAKLHQEKQVGFSHLSNKTALQIVIYVLGLLPSLCQHLETARAFFQELTEENDGVIDGVNTEETNLMIACFERIFSCFTKFFSWSGFSSVKNKCHLKAALVVLASRTKITKKSQTNFQELLHQTFSYFEQFATNSPSIGAGVELIKLSLSLKARAEKEDISLAISAICGGFLKQEWFQGDGQREQGTKYNENLQYLLKHYIHLAQDPLKIMEDISTGAVADLLEQNERPTSTTTMPTLTKASFPTFYKSLLDALVNYFKITQSTAIKHVDSIESRKERLVQINISVRIFHVLVNLVKAFEHRVVLGAALKYGRLFVELFVSYGMPVLDEMLRHNKDQIHALLKSFQQSTRSLQHFCGHTKVVKDVSLTNHVPALKKSLETFVFRVKAMLAVNRCGEAFWMGNLKNRDLHGQEISSQVSTKASEENNEEEEGEDVDESREEEKSNDERESIISCETGVEHEEENESCSESF